MTEQKWDAQSAVEELRPKLWRYLSPAAAIGQGTSVRPELDLSRTDLVHIFATHLAVAQSTEKALASAEQLLRRMPSSLSAQRVELQGSIRGQVHWQNTYTLRAATGDPTIFVCSPPERRYDTPLGRLIHVTLRHMAKLASLSGLSEFGEVGAAVHSISDRARRLLLDPKLSKVRQVRHGSLNNMDQLVRRRPQAADLLDFVRRYVSGIVDGDPDQLRELLETQFLAPAEEPRLFELQVGFAILETLEEFGLSLERPLPLLPGGRLPFAILRQDGIRAAVYWQQPVWVLSPKQAKAGLWWTVLDANGLSSQPLRPDFLVDLPGSSRRFLVEVKLTGRESYSPDRDGLRDALGYLADGDLVFRGLPSPHALVVAWNSKAYPRGASPIQVASQTTLRETLRSFMS